MSELFFTHQVPDAQQLLKLLRHWIMLHGHEDGVEHDAQCDTEVNKRVHDDGVEPLLQPPPAAAAVPLQEDVSEGIPPHGTRPLVILKV